MNCSECGCPRSVLSRVGVRFHSGEARSCSLCGKGESMWPSTIAKQSNAQISSQILNQKHFHDAIVDKKNNTSGLRSCNRCGSKCEGEKSKWHGNAAAQCCVCKGSFNSCSHCAPRQLFNNVQQHSGAGPASKVLGALIRVTGFDNTSVELTKQDAASRSARLDSNIRGPFFHQTAGSACQGIINDDKMRRGKTGIAGGGIYFAVSSSDTMHKAHWHGYLLTVRVRLGNVEKWGANDIDRSLTFAKLQARGVDTIHIPRNGGDEFIVYSSDQVELLNAQLVQLPRNYPVGKENAGFFPKGTECILTGPAIPCSVLRRSSAAMSAFIDKRDAELAAGKKSEEKK